MLRLLNQRSAQALDIELMQVPGFTIDQLMELAGLAVACSIAAAYPVSSFGRVLTVAGPGNNGGDALVAARHLKHFGYAPVVLYPKKSKKQLFLNMVTECEQLEIPFVEAFPGATEKEFDLILDGIFGFSFDPKGGVRAPFDSILSSLVALQTKIPVASIDIPSGWHVEDGHMNKENMLHPDMLISLTAPKLCARHFTGKHHYLGGRFLPPKLAVKYGIENLPKYPGTAQCVALDQKEVCEAKAAPGNL